MPDTRTNTEKVEKQLLILWLANIAFFLLVAGLNWLMSKLGWPFINDPGVYGGLNIFTDLLSILAIGLTVWLPINKYSGRDAVIRKTKCLAWIWALTFLSVLAQLLRPQKFGAWNTIFAAFCFTMAGVCFIGWDVLTTEKNKDTKDIKKFLKGK
jgi:hypothetical protein